MQGQYYEDPIDAARALNLMNSSGEWEMCLLEASSHAFPVQMRRLFADILIFCECLNPAELFHIFKREFAPMKRDKDEDVTDTDIAIALLHISQLLELHNMKLSDYGLPEIDMSLVNVEIERQLAEEINHPPEKDHQAESILLEKSLTAEQLVVYNRILDAVENVNTSYTKKLFFLQASGGCGKTYIYRYCYHF